LGLCAASKFCTSRPLTTTDRASGSPCPGCGTTSHATATLKASAAQYAGRMRQARRCANREMPSSRQPWRAGDKASENPDSTMNTTTAKRP
jgi:hypothetical protein